MITASTLMHCKAQDLVDALLAKMYLTTSIAMDWLHNLLRQLLHLRLLPHQLRHQRQHRLQVLQHAQYLHRVIASK
jgi:hypothetical protein